MLESITKELNLAADPTRAKILAGFFKTGKGQYGEGDFFWGITVPECRGIAVRYSHLSFAEIQKLLKSKIHEHRLTALLILVHQYKTGDSSWRKEIYDFYLENTSYINNWDLVDLTADKILGNYLLDKDPSILLKLSKSSVLWERRIAIIATFAFIRRNKYDRTFQISKILLDDTHDLIHKAVGWMLREVGKRDLNAEERFLRKYYKNMPRVMLRYAIERFSKDKQNKYLQR